MKLEHIAYARSGDKGDNVNIGVIAINPQDFSFLLDFLSEQRVKAYFHKWNPVAIKRYELPKINALNFILVGVLNG